MSPLLALLLCLALCAAASAHKDHHIKGKHLLKEVNVLGGTQSTYELSHGNSLPLITRPWGFNGWAPQTTYPGNGPDRGAWWFHPEDRFMCGIRCTHQPSPWINDWGNFLVSTRLIGHDHGGSGQCSGYNPRNAEFKPYHFRTELLRYGTQAGQTTLEVTASDHASIMRTTFPPLDSAEVGFNQTRQVVIEIPESSTEDVTIDEDDVMVLGSTRSNSGGVSEQYRLHVCLTVAGGRLGDKPVTLKAARMANSSSLVFVSLLFDETDPNAEHLTVRVATSLISSLQCQLNLKEVLNRSFDEVLAESKFVWEMTLQPVEIVKPGKWLDAHGEDQVKVFSSCLYRSVLFPRFSSEIDLNGDEVHASTYNESGGVYPGVSVTDSGFWDAYRAVYPFLALVYPDVHKRIVEGWTASYNEGGWLVKWASPGYRGSMTGTCGDNSLGEAIVIADKQDPGFNVTQVWEAIWKDASVIPPLNGNGSDWLYGIGRLGMESYVENGYVAALSLGSTNETLHETVGRTLDYSLSDFAVAAAARALGYSQEADLLEARSKAAARHLFDTKTAFFRPKFANGSWMEPFDQFEWGDQYTEAGPWQYRFSLPHAPQLLAELYREAGIDVCDKLKEAQTFEALFHVGGYWNLIHEMNEFTQNDWGQYAHSNQPSHHILYMFAAVGGHVASTCAQEGQRWLRRAQLELYKPTNDMFTGDEDNGEMSSWFLLTAMGLYQLAPGSGDYVLGIPLFDHVRITRPDGTSLDIIAHNNDKHVVVDRVTFNGQTIKGSTISFAQLATGGTLEFHLKKDHDPLFPSRSRGSPAHGSVASATSVPEMQWWLSTGVTTLSALFVGVLAGIVIQKRSKTASLSNVRGPYAEMQGYAF